MSAEDPIYYQRNWWVDWSDDAYPEIRHAKFALDSEYLVTLAQAKKEIVEKFQAEVTHAREQIRKARAIRVKDLET